MLPELSAATQNNGDAHETELSELSVVSTWTGALHELPLKVSAYPAKPTAAQNDDDGHDTAAMYSSLEAWFTVAGPDHAPPL